MELEIARDAGRGEPRVNAAAAGASQAIVQRERDAVPLSERTGRLSANGRFVALISAARLIERDRNDLRDVYVFDGETGGLTLETLGHLGQPADGESRAVDISADGRFVVFAAEAGNLTDPLLRSRHLPHISAGPHRRHDAAVDGQCQRRSSEWPESRARRSTPLARRSRSSRERPISLAPGPANGIFLASVAYGTITRVDEAADG